MAQNIIRPEDELEANLDAISTAGQPTEQAAVNDEDLLLQNIDNQVAYDAAQAQYGNRPISAFGAGLARGAALGTSDIALTQSGLVSPETLSGLQTANPVASTAGEVVGAVAPAVASLFTPAGPAGPAAVAGTTAARIGARQAIARGLALTPAGLAARAGTAVAKGAGAKLGTGVLATGAAVGLGGALEGGLQGVGQAVSDDALERKELSAESIGASAGLGALLGGGFGAAAGTALAGAPAAFRGLKRGAQSIVPDSVSNAAGAVKQNIKEATKSFIDPFETILNTVSDSSPTIIRLRDRLASQQDEFVDFWRNEVNPSIFNTPNTAYKQVVKLQKEAGKTIGEISEQLDNVVAKGDLPVRRSTVYQPLIDKTQEFINAASTTGGFQDEELRLARKYLQRFVKLGSDEAPFSFKQFDDVRKLLGKNAFGKDGRPLSTFNAQIAEPLRDVSRGLIDDIAAVADNLVPGVGQNLQKANRIYHFTKLVEDPLERASEKTFRVGITDLLSTGLFGVPAEITRRLGAAALRNAAIISNIGARTKAVKDTIAQSVEDAFKATKTSGNVSRAYRQAILSTNFALKRDEPNKKPKNRLEAFNNVRDNVTELIADQNKLVELLAEKTARVNNASPTTGLVLQERLVTALNFLQQKLPKSGVTPGMFQRPYQPSSMELAKFERYLQVVDKPLSALEDLKNGTLTREHVEALQAVYPEIYREIQLKVLDKMATQPNLPYARRLQLGILLGIPADSSLQPASVMQLQASFEPQDEQPSGVTGQPDFRPAGADNLSLAGRAETDVQALQADDE